MPNEAAPTAPFLPPRPDLRRRVLAGEATIGLWLGLGSIIASEIVARAGYDWVVADLEHGMAGETELLGQLVAVQGTPTAALVRVVSSERMRIARVLDLGADGVVIPRLETVGEMGEALSWMRFPPAGIRGVAAGTRGPGYGTVPHAQLHTINERILGVFQVESAVAVAAAPELAAIDGVDVLFIGPADLSHDLGIPGEFTNPRFTDALDRVAAAARAHGKPAGILQQDAGEVSAYLARGYRFLGVGSDYGLVARGARGQLAEARRDIG